MILAVDPGLTGAMAWTDGVALSVRDMPTRLEPVNRKMRKVIDEPGVERLLRTARLHTSILLIEQVNGMPGQSGPAAFTFGYGVGIVRGMAAALGYRIETVAPARWKGATSTPANKDGARARASEVWPRQAGLWARKMDDGRAEAAIMAHYGWQVYGRGPNDQG
jgi:hypothetical protein